MKWVSHWGSDYYSDVMESFGQAQINNALIIYSYLTSHGFNHNSVCAILGNMMTESYLNPGQWQHGYSPYDGNQYNGMGLVGWTPYWRITDWLNEHGYDLSNPESYGYGMLDKLIEECFNPQEVTWISTSAYPLSFEEFATDTTHTIEWLATAFLKNYERPAVGDQPARATQARKWHDILSGEITQYTPRLTSDGINGNACYYTHNPFYQSGYGLPNCTCYAWGRWCELLAQYTGEHTPTLSLGNADSWYQYNINNGFYEYGQTPKLGAICVWSYDGGGDGGHVAVVEQINSDGSIVTSNSAWGGTFFYTQVLKESEGYEWGSFTNFLGFIYFPYEFGTGPIIPTPTPTTKKKKKKFKWVLFNKNRSVRI